MIREEAIRLLSNTKIYVKDKGDEIQNKLMEIGFCWSSNHKKQALYRCFPFLYLDDDMSIKRGNNIIVFNRAPEKEISAEELLSIDITEPFRPFNGKEECWQAMLRHTPFGWLVEKGVSERRKYTTVYDIQDDGMKVSGTGAFVKFCDALNNFEFPDGTPFGVENKQS